MIESRKTHAAFIYGNKWLKIAERITKEDGAVSFRNVAEMSPELTVIPSGISAEARAEIHARAVGAVGPAPEAAALQGFGSALAIGKLLRTAVFSE